MAKIKNYIRFSEAFNVSTKELSKEGLLDPFLNVDTDLFIDPLLLKHSKNKIINTDAVQLFEKHFENVQLLLSQSTENENDIVWKSARRLLTIKDLPSTCLGYGASSTSGRSLPYSVTTQILRNSKRLIDIGITNPKIFSLVPMIEDGVGADMISDLTSFIIRDSLAKITELFAQKYIKDFAPCSVSIKEDSYLLPYNKYNQKPILLIPSDILRKIPIATDWDSMIDAINRTQELRSKFSNYIGAIWANKSKKSKKELRDNILSSKESVLAYWDLIQKLPKEPYDLNKDNEGFFKWANYIKNLPHLSLENIPSGHTISDLKLIVNNILNHFKNLIENNGLYEVIYDDNKKPRKERIAQRTFFAVAKKICDDNNIDVSPEVNSGNGAVDFKFSKGGSEKILVEIKLSTNRKILEGYSKQLEAYKKSEYTDNGVLLVIEVDGGIKNISKKLFILQNEYKSNVNISEVFLIDGRIKKSASKL